MNRFANPLVALLMLATYGSAQDSPMFRGNLARTGVAAGAPVAKFSRVRWAFPTGGRIISTPAVVSGSAYFGSTDGNVYAVDIANGSKRWEYKTGARVSSSPAVVNDVVYVNSYDGIFYALNAAGGSLKWKFVTKGERRFAGTHLHGRPPAGEAIPDPFDVYLSSPAVWRGIVYFGSGDGNVYALDAGSGVLRWKFHTGNVVHASPALADGVLYIGSWDTWFYALDATTGRLRWRFKTGEDAEIHNQTGIQGTAAIAGGVVYFQCRDSHVYALDARTGVRKWALNLGGSWGMGSPAVRGSSLWFATADGLQFHEVDALTGKERFTLKGSWYFSASPTIVGNFAYAANWDGRLVAINLTDRTEAWTIQTDSSRVNRAKYINADGSMNYRATKSESFADDYGLELYRIYSMGSFFSSPVVVDGVLYIGSMDGNLYAVM